MALFRTFGSMPALLPVGGERVWGSATSSPEGSVGTPFVTLHRSVAVPSVSAQSSGAGDGATDDDECEAGNEGETTAPGPGAAEASVEVTVPLSVSDVMSQMWKYVPPPFPLPAV